MQHEDIIRCHEHDSSFPFVVVVDSIDRVTEAFHFLRVIDVAVFLYDLLYLLVIPQA